MMMGGVCTGSLALYLVVGITGYVLFGSCVCDNISVSFGMQRPAQPLSVCVCVRARARACVCLIGLFVDTTHQLALKSRPLTLRIA